MSPWSWFYSDINLDTNVTDLEGLEFSLSSTAVAIGALLPVWSWDDRLCRTGDNTRPCPARRSTARTAADLPCTYARISCTLAPVTCTHTQQTQTIRTHITLHFTLKAQSHNNVGPVLHVTWAEQMRRPGGHCIHCRVDVEEGWTHCWACPRTTGPHTGAPLATPASLTTS